ncbi:type II RES/Xre toxin-antitoxin system antitoxin [Algoriphagus antarcticus]|uniref:Putative toxin-antitoxin system antitoxin component (TIGR02293 family) n=1 Tax=Algoriphagus antarcticus TaxID=238540 RepID=A0A3E0DKJ9_9BACT|nr:antitoxin Xre/MbcA/ParS toxin-binding domain-containing protein [Algoriphagus antarcticus]REG82313.1 putative toxin-antitoxin system antitoxin component (TIGR02293 family) [Algoriphagus antarcticus]
MEKTIDRYQKLNTVLGKENLKDRVDSPYDFITIANKGLNSNAIVHFKVYFDLSQKFTAALLNLSEPTLYRLQKSRQDLKRNSSVQLLEAADLFLYGIEVFESKENFFKWLHLPNTSLGDIEPQELIEIPGGISKVRDVLGRIEHGVYS